MKTKFIINLSILLFITVLNGCGRGDNTPIDTDGDGIPDEQEIVGCGDENATNYNPNATDIDNDNDEDLIVIGEFMGINILLNENGFFRFSKSEL